MIHLGTEMAPLAQMCLPLAIPKFTKTRGIKARIVAHGHVGERLMYLLITRTRLSRSAVAVGGNFMPTGLAWSDLLPVNYGAG